MSDQGAENPRPSEPTGEKVTAEQFAEFVGAKMEGRGRKPKGSDAEDGSPAKFREATFGGRGQRPIRITERFDQGHGKVIDVTDEEEGEVYTVDPLGKTVERRTLDEHGRPSPLGTVAEDLTKIKQRLDERIRPTIKQRLADRLEAMGARPSVVERFRRESTPRGRRATRILSAGVAAAIALGGAAAVVNQPESPAPSEPGIGAPAEPGQEQEHQKEAQEVAVEHAQSIIDDLKNPNLGTVADPDGQGFSNNLAGFNTDGSDPNASSEYVDGTQVGSVRLETTPEGQNYITVSGFVHTNQDGVSEEDYVAYMFRAPEGMDPDGSGDIGLDEFRDAIGKQEAGLLAASVGVGIQEILEFDETGAAVGSQQIAGEQLLVLVTPNGLVVTDRYGGGFGSGLLNADASKIFAGTYAPRDLDSGEPLDLRPATDATIENLGRMGEKATNTFTDNAGKTHIPGGA